MGKGAIVCLPQLWYLSPSWGCCDYLVKIATLSTQTKLTMANDPLTVRESASSAVFAHIEFDTILPQPHPHTNTPTATITTMCSRADSIFLISCQKAISWGVGRVLSVTQWTHVPETPRPLLQGLNGERWYRPKCEITQRRPPWVCVSLLRLNIKA